MTDQMRSATWFVLGAVAISGINHILTEMAARGAGDAAALSAVRVSIAALPLILAAALGPPRLSPVRRITGMQFVRLMGLGVLAGFPFALYFSGVVLTGAAAANAIRTALMFVVALAAVRVFRERMTSSQWFGAAALLVTNLLLWSVTTVPDSVGIQLVAAAALFWGVETLLAKRVLRDTAAKAAVVARMVVGAVVLWLIVIWRGSWTVIANWGEWQWFLVFVTSMLLAFYVACWYSALQRAPVTYVATLLLAAPIATNIAAGFFGRTVSTGAIVGSVVMALAAVFVIRFLPRPAPVR